MRNSVSPNKTHRALLSVYILSESAEKINPFGTSGQKTAQAVILQDKKAYIFHKMYRKRRFKFG